MLKLVALVVALLCAPILGAAETIRIGAWNIQDLHHDEGHSLRLLGNLQTVKRTTSDFELLETYRDLFGKDGTSADVIALQEIGTKAALERLFPVSIYGTLMSPRWTDDNAPEFKGTVYTAIAVRKASGVQILKVSHLPQLSMMSLDGRYTRAGTGALLQVGDTKFWFLSVHLKSGCADTKKIHLSTGKVCETLWRQALVLRDWIEKVREDEVPIIIVGDFNRQFRRLEDNYALWRAINGLSPEETVENAWFEKHPRTVTRRCPTKKGKGTEPIDWILVDAKLSESVIPRSFHETRWSKNDVDAAQGGRGLSDHCPISLDIRF